MSEAQISLETISTYGKNLHRPECVLCTTDGSVYASDWRGGVTQIKSDGSQVYFLDPDNTEKVQTNGFAIQNNGDFLIANLGDAGGIWQLSRTNKLKPFLMEVDNELIPPANFVHIDKQDRIWVSVSTRLQPRALGYRKDVADGFVALIDQNGARIVADGLGYTNEVQVSPDGKWLYVNETFGRKMSRFPILPSGDLGAKEVFTDFGAGTFPDGLCFDEYGNAWITSIISNRVIKISPDGSQKLMLEDADKDNLLLVEEAFGINELGRPHLDNITSKKLKSISSLAFGGPDCRTAYLGCLLADCVYTFDPNTTGMRPYHWGISL